MQIYSAGISIPSYLFWLCFSLSDNQIKNALIIKLTRLQLMEEFKRAHQKMFNSAQQKAQSTDQVLEKVRKAN